MAQHDTKLGSPNCGDCPIRHRAVCARCETDELKKLEEIKYYGSDSGERTTYVYDDKDNIIERKYFDEEGEFQSHEGTLQE